ncbi:cell adhesion molecule CEACAM1-like [Pelodytes ibericus]
MFLSQSLLPWTLLLIVLGPVSSVQNVNGSEGESANLSVNLTLPALDNRQITWRFVTGNQNIVNVYTNNPPRYTELYIGRCEVFDNTNLRLDRLTAADQGDYTLSVQNLNSGITDTGTVHLTVFSFLKPPNIIANVSYPINGSDVALHCDPLNQTVTSYSFQPNVCSKDHVTCNGSSLLFHPITESDAGNYTCTIANPISTNTSKPLVVRVAEYVSAVMIQTNTSSLLWVGVDSVSINCSALGTDVHFSWNLNGAPIPQNSRYHLNQDSSILTISPVDRSDNGSFTCTASNWFSNETSNSANLSLAWPPEGNITCSAPVTNGTAELQCSWPGGFPSADVRMLFQNKNITEKNQVIVKVNVITINSSTDNLICYGIQGGLEVGCSVRLGKPEAVGFTNNSIKTVAEGESITLSVSLLRSAGRHARPARSIPEEVLPASFSWFHYTPDPTPVSSGGNFLVASTRYTSSLTVSSVTEKQNGTYECVAENQYGSENFLFMINVTAKAVSPTSPSALGPGEIAGIVIGVLAAVGIIGIIIFFSLKAKKKKPKAESPRINGDQIGATNYAVINLATVNGGVAETPISDKSKEDKDDVKYAVIHFKNQDPAKPAPAATPETEYSTIKTASTK